MNKEKIISIGAVVLVVGVVAGLAIWGGSKLKNPIIAKSPTVATEIGRAHV